MHETLSSEERYVSEIWNKRVFATERKDLIYGNHKIWYTWTWPEDSSSYYRDGIWRAKPDPGKSDSRSDGRTWRNRSGTDRYRKNSSFWYSASSEDRSEEPETAGNHSVSDKRTGNPGSRWDPQTEQVYAWHQDPSGIRRTGYRKTDPFLKRWCAACDRNTGPSDGSSSPSYLTFRQPSHDRAGWSRWDAEHGIPWGYWDDFERCTGRASDGSLFCDHAEADHGHHEKLSERCCSGSCRKERTDRKKYRPVLLWSKTEEQRRSSLKTSGYVQSKALPCILQYKKTCGWADWGTERTGIFCGRSAWRYEAEPERPCYERLPQRQNRDPDRHRCGSPWYWCRWCRGSV